MLEGVKGCVQVATKTGMSAVAETQGPELLPQEVTGCGAKSVLLSLARENLVPGYGRRTWFRSASFLGSGYTNADFIYVASVTGVSVAFAALAHQAMQCAPQLKIHQSEKAGIVPAELPQQVLLQSFPLLVSNG